MREVAARNRGFLARKDEVKASDHSESGAAYCGYVTAVSAETGEELWSVRPDDHSAAAKITGASWEEIPALNSEHGCCTLPEPAQGGVIE